MAQTAASRVRVLPLAAIALAALLAAQAAHEAFGLGGSELDTFFDKGVHNFLISAAAAACLARAWITNRGRAAWTMVGLSLVAFAIGDILSTTLYTSKAKESAATIADVFWLAYYPLVVAGLVFLIHDRIEGFDLHRWIDGIAAALIVVTFGVSLFIEPVFQKSREASTVGGVIQFAYPICDVMLLGAAIGIFALTAWRPGKAWLLLGLGLFLFAGADSVAAVQAVEGTFQAGKYDFVWSGGALLIAWAAWMPYPARQRPVLLRGWKAVALPITCQVLAGAVQITALFHHVPKSERVLTVLVLALVIAQLWISRPRVPE